MHNTVELAVPARHSATDGRLPVRRGAAGTAVAHARAHAAAPNSARAALVRFIHFAVVADRADQLVKHMPAVATRVILV